MSNVAGRLGTYHPHTQTTITFVRMCGALMIHHKASALSKVIRSLHRVHLSKVQHINHNHALITSIVATRSELASLAYSLNV